MAVRTKHQRNSATKPAAPWASTGSPYRWMCTSSSTSKERVKPLALGQMTLTRWPALARLGPPSHTRRSNGTGRLWTTIRTRRGLPADAIVAVPIAASVDDADEVDDPLPGPRALGDGPERRVVVGDHQGPGVVEDLLDARHHQVGDVGDLVEDLALVGADQLGQVDVGVVDPDLVALADQPLHHLDHGALAQVVGARLEGQPQHPDLAGAGVGAQLGRPPPRPGRSRAGVRGPP